MKRKILIAAFALPLILINPMFAQSKDALKTIMNNEWVKKYKKLKSDLEDKAGYAKNLSTISSADEEVLKSSYQQTSRMLDTWLDHLVTSIESNNTLAITQLSEGTINEDLKIELLEIFTFYANDFSLKYEEITGEKTRSVVSHTKLMSDGQKVANPDAAVQGKIERNFLISNVKKPLQATSWNALF